MLQEATTTTTTTGRAHAAVPGLTASLSVALGMLVCLVVFRRARFVRALRNIPWPRALPVLGNAVQLNCSLEEFFKKLILWSKEYGDIYLIWVGLRPFVFVYKVESVQPLLNSSQHIDKSLEYKYLKPWLGEGLITGAGKKWHARRKMLTSIFHNEQLKEYCQISSRKAEIFVSCLRAEIGKPEFDIVPYAKRAALDVITESTMGYQLNAQSNFRNEYVLAVHSLTTISQIRFTNIWIQNDALFKRTSLGKEHDKALKIVHGLVDKIIAERKIQYQMKKEANLPNSTSSKSTILLDLLLEKSENGEKLSDSDIREEVNTFMFAGHDTAGVSISWILYTLGRYPQYQEKILDEYNELIDSGLSHNESIQKCTWLEACMKEAWRLYPIVPLIARQIYRPIKLQGTDIPSGTTVLINMYLLHRDPSYFANPDSFEPERFLVPPSWPCFAYVPFSAGSRNCIGTKFATMEIKVMVVTLLRAYAFRSIDSEAQLRLVSEVVLGNVGGIRLSITPRHSSE